MRRLLTALLLLATAPALADDFRIGAPILCTIGADCWPVRGVDAVGGADYGDYTCRKVGQDKHSGVDFAIRDRDAMARDVPVVAVADGIVVAARDEADDSGARSAADIAKLNAARNNCGNAVVIRHRDGWSSQYCHMRSKSVRVQRGQRVSAGETIGLIGNSGEASYPHVHMTLRHGNDVIDPYTGLKMEAGCNQGGTPLWRADAGLSTPVVPLFSAGFTAETPTVLSVTDGVASRRNLPDEAPQLLFWAAGYYIAKGDVWTLRITGPDGAVVAEQTETVADPKAVGLRWTGKRRPGAAWPAGRYTGQATLTQTLEGRPVTAEMTAHVDIH